MGPYMRLSTCRAAQMTQPPKKRIIADSAILPRRLLEDCLSFSVCPGCHSLPR